MPTLPRDSQQRGWLHVTVVKAEDLAVADADSSDPFVTLTLEEPEEAGRVGHEEGLFAPVLTLLHTPVYRSAGVYTHRG